ncbi:hydrogenase nickel incorporation protein HypB [Candidatus Solincola tengchongensis]|uniref:hydrogenase nickel incorporation protein HypB n=1 Tax=Candidatus Solincola tengchongensis TaxID=2900693 RepID=UPI00257DF332|nr:hydrogenase nickel incorporation protein HypB [Candidatus Solincola tengchongensis]
MDIQILEGVFDANERIARENEALFRENGVLAVNLMASPGAGKTSLVSRTLELLAREMNIGVIEGDIASSVDAEKIKSYGVPVVQINTGGACHLDASMIREALGHLDLSSLDLLIIENVGNLVCPAEFNLGEGLRAMILSVAEGHDKPLKYPLMFSQSHVLLVNKIDLLGLSDFDLGELRETVRRMNPEMVVFEISCRTGEGLQAWADWLRNRAAKKG